MPHSLIIPSPDRRKTLRLFGPFAIYYGKRNIIETLSARESELLLLLILHTFVCPNIQDGEEAGVTSSRLEAAFWPEATRAVLKNRKNVLFHKLRRKLAPFPFIQIDYRNHRHIISFSDDMSFPFLEYCLLKDTPVTAKTLKEILSILNPGPFLADRSYAWLDQLQDRINEDVIIFLARTLETLSPDDPQLWETAETLLRFDEYHEAALRKYLRFLIHKGLRHLALKKYRDANRKYLTDFSESLPFTLAEL